MTQSLTRYELDLGSHACRIRIEGTKPGKQVKVLVRDNTRRDSEPLHGTGVLGVDLQAFTATFPAPDGEQTLVLAWPQLKAELAKFPKYD